MPGSDCIFCQIVGEDIPSHRVTTGEHTVAFLDVNPLATGHTLVVPREHHERLQDCPADEATDLWSVVHELLPAIKTAVDADATTVGVNNGEAAGQEIHHTHVHIVPRFVDDGGGPIHAIGGRRPELDDEELASLASSIADNV